MSGSFVFSAEAEPFVPMYFNQVPKREEILQVKIDTLQSELENEKLNNMKIMELYKDRCSKDQEQSNDRLTSLHLENERLNKKLRKASTRILEERSDKIDIENKLSIKERYINHLIMELGIKDDKYDILHRRFDNLNREFTIYKERGDPEIWIGRCLKLDFILKKIKQIEALPEDHGAWVWDMVEDIEFPDGSINSVFLTVPNSIRNRYLPYFEDAGINFQPGEEDIIDELSREAEAFNSLLSENLRRNLDENPELVMNGIRTIQSRFREHIRPNLEKRIKSVIKIQSVWRGFCGRGIISYKGNTGVNSSQTVYKILLNKEIYSTRKILNEDIRNSTCEIYFANTSNEIINYQWLNIDPITLEGKVGRKHYINPGKIIMIKSYYGHWFRFKKESETGENFFRLMPFLGNLRRDEFGRGMCRKIVFDMNTKLTITKEHYDEWTRGVSGPKANRVLNTQHLTTERPEVIHRNNPIPQEEEEDDDDARLMLAIQLSLEQTNALTSDAVDFNIGNLFSGIYQ